MSNGMSCQEYLLREDFDLTTRDVKIINKLKVPRPKAENGRMQYLRKAKIFDSNEHDEEYDRLTTLASRVFKVPICLVSLIDVDRQWFKSRVGLIPAETHRDLAFCSYTILEHTPDVFVVPDPLEDERFCNSPLVHGYPHIRFYAGAALITNGIKLGSFCIIDTVPHHDFDSYKQKVLFSIGTLVTKKLEERYREYQLKETAITRLAMSVVYNLKHPLYMSDHHSTKLGSARERLQELFGLSNQLLASHTGSDNHHDANRSHINDTNVREDDSAGKTQPASASATKDNGGSIATAMGESKTALINDDNNNNTRNNSNNNDDHTGVKASNREGFQPELLKKELLQTILEFKQEASELDKSLEYLNTVIESGLRFAHGQTVAASSRPSSARPVSSCASYSSSDKGKLPAGTAGTAGETGDPRSHHSSKHPEDALSSLPSSTVLSQQQIIENLGLTTVNLSAHFEFMQRVLDKSACTGIKPTWTMDDSLKKPLGTYLFQPDVIMLLMFSTVFHVSARWHQVTVNVRFETLAESGDAYHLISADSVLRQDAFDDETLCGSLIVTFECAVPTSKEERRARWEHSSLLHRVSPSASIPSHHPDKRDTSDGRNCNNHNSNNNTTTKSKSSSSADSAAIKNDGIDEEKFADGSSKKKEESKGEDKDKSKEERDETELEKPIQSSPPPAGAAALGSGKAANNNDRMLGSTNDKHFDEMILQNVAEAVSGTFTYKKKGTALPAELIEFKINLQDDEENKSEGADAKSTGNCGSNNNNNLSSTNGEEEGDGDGDYFDFYELRLPCIILHAANTVKQVKKTSEDNCCHVPGATSTPVHPTKTNPATTSASMGTASGAGSGSASGAGSASTSGAAAGSTSGAVAGSTSGAAAGSTSGAGAGAVDGCGDLGDMDGQEEELSAVETRQEEAVVSMVNFVTRSAIHAVKDILGTTASAESKDKARVHPDAAAAGDAAGDT